MHWGASSVCPSVCAVHDPRSRMEGHRKLKIGRKEPHDTGDRQLHLEVERSKSLGRLMPWPKISHIFGMGRPMNFVLGTQMEYMSYNNDMRGELKGHVPRLPGHLMPWPRDRKSVISLERESLQSSNLVHGWSMMPTSPTWACSIAVRMLVSAGELSLSCARVLAGRQ